MNNGPHRRMARAAILVCSVAVILAQAPAPPPVAPLADLVVPPGFSISVFASGLPGARLMTVSPEGVLLVARRRTHEVVALPDKNKDGIAEPEVILDGLTTANSLAFQRRLSLHRDHAGGDARAVDEWRAGWRPRGVCRAAELHAGGPHLTGARLRPRRPSLRLDRFVVRRLHRSRPATHHDPGVRRGWHRAAVCDRPAQCERVRLGSRDRPLVGRRQRPGRARPRLST